MNRLLARATLWTSLALTIIGSGLVPVSWLSAGPAAAGALAQPNYQVSVQPIVASGFAQPVQVTHAGDGSNRLFVVEQNGFIRIVKNGAVLGTPFLDVSALSSCCGERGLLGLAFHPNYETNGYFYVNYTNNQGDTQIVRYSVSTPDVADPNSARTLLIVDQPYVNHNGGQLLFGRDGYLYIGMGDGGSGGDPGHRAQDIDQLLGKMLRIDVTGVPTYTIPGNNPYVGKPGRDEIWAVGLRNPWRFSFDRLSGDLYIGDVGQNAWEEVDYQAYGTPGGVNFGWPCREGTHTYLSSNPDPRCNDPLLIASLTPPIVEYANTGPYQAVTGGFVYRGGDFPSLYGRYFYADYAAGRIWSVAQSGSGWSQPVTEIAATGFAISSFGEDERGELYVVDYSGGTIRRLIDTLKPIYLPIICRNCQ